MVRLLQHWQQNGTQKNFPTPHSIPNEWVCPARPHSPAPTRKRRQPPAGRQLQPVAQSPARRRLPQISLLLASKQSCDINIFTNYAEKPSSLNRIVYK
jgi:hypothetical protein